MFVYRCLYLRLDAPSTFPTVKKQSSRSCHCYRSMNFRGKNFYRFADRNVMFPLPARTCTVYPSHGGKVHLLSYASSNESMRVAKHDQFRKIYHHAAKDVAPPIRASLLLLNVFDRSLAHRFKGCIPLFSFIPDCRCTRTVQSL